MKKWKAVIILPVICAAFVMGCANKENKEYSKDAGQETDAAEQMPGGQMMEDQPAGDDSADKSLPGNSTVPEDSAAAEDSTAPEAPITSEKDVIRPEGMTLEERFAEPEGFSRVEDEAGSLAEFLREYPLKEDGSPVLLYDGTEKGNQRAHAAVFALPIENEDLQQCADSIMRVYAEYFWESGQQERIAFHFVNGFYAQYTRWRDGERIQVNGNDVSWVRSADYDDSYENLKKYLRYVFSYAGTLSMDAEAEPIALDDLRVGDVFLKGGSPGHVVLVVDLCENAQGERAFLLAQGYMPAQEFHVLKNPLHEDDPWYYMDEVCFPLKTPEYTFEEGSLRRPGY